MTALDRLLDALGATIPYYPWVGLTGGTVFTLMYVVNGYPWFLTLAIVYFAAAANWRAEDFLRQGE